MSLLAASTIVSSLGWAVISAWTLVAIHVWQYSIGYLVGQTRGILESAIYCSESVLA
jgi:hypothetical protein